MFSALVRVEDADIIVCRKDQKLPNRKHPICAVELACAAFHVVCNANRILFVSFLNVTDLYHRKLIPIVKSRHFINDLVNANNSTFALVCKS